MIYVEAPGKIESYSALTDCPKLFLAGGITGCLDWQSIVVDRLEDQEIVILNPRRKDFDMSSVEMAYEQIEWEHDNLRLADVIMFWFCANEPQPIALYELGAWSIVQKPIAVGCDPQYPRRLDVRTQTKLVRPEVEVRDTLENTLLDALELCGNPNAS